MRKEVSALCGLAALMSWKKNRWATLGFGATAGLLWLSQIRSKETFEGQSVLITGGSRGLGLALARRLAAEGAKLTLLARDGEELQRASRLIRDTHPNAPILTVTCDVTQDHQVADALKRVRNTFGGLDMVINNAGSILVGPYECMTKEDFEAQMNLHLYAVMNMINRSLPMLRAGTGKRIVNICSMGGRVAVPHMLPYDTSKFALAGYSQGLMAELAPEGISVTTVYPTVMRTGSPIQAVFKGDHEKEFAWFAIADVLPFLSMSADGAARKILRAARDRSAELMPSLPGKLRMVAAGLAPETYSMFMRALGAAMPKGTSMHYKTGAQSRQLFDKMEGARALRKRARDAEHKWNQRPRHTAKFNMGLKKTRHESDTHEGFQVH
jgi:NAD(P)-dependent dehydrogenase (short-subunit alcohol dehydrogenase family)